MLTPSDSGNWELLTADSPEARNINPGPRAVSRLCLWLTRSLPFQSQPLTSTLLSLSQRRYELARHPW